MGEGALSSRAQTDGADLVDYYRPLVGMFRARLASSRRDMAEPLANDTLLAALVRQQEDPASVRDPVAFLWGIAEKKLNDFVRKSEREQRAIERLTVEHERLAQLVMRAGEEERLLEAERLTILAAAVERLDPQEREMIALRFTDGMTNAEAAQQMRLDADDASRLKYRVLEKLRSLLAERKPPRRRS